MGKMAEWLYSLCGKAAALMGKAGTDGLMHVIASAALTRVLALVMPLFMAVALAALAGITKEFLDWLTGKGSPEKKDLVCDALGIALAAI